ncbi:MAG: type II toxin-antitoxin system RelE/ParE family toxin [Acidobacteria bacterium]|nr:type II toxin-antitoxin system RelE/ParE family toxin [Acidobacteriota bacterium]
MKAALSSAAERDVKQALDYYLREAGTKVAEDFIDQLESKIERIKLNPEAYRIEAKDLRCANLDRFPYQIVYRIASKSLIRVTSVRHQKRHPDFGLQR